jgi:hypothetical protein
MTDELFNQISDRIDIIQSKIEFLNEVEMRIDSILGNLIEEEEEEEEEEELEDETDEEEYEDDEEVVEEEVELKEEDILSELESILTANTTYYTG